MSRGKGDWDARPVTTWREERSQRKAATERKGGFKVIWQVLREVLALERLSKQSVFLLSLKRINCITLEFSSLRHNFTRFLDHISTSQEYTTFFPVPFPSIEMENWGTSVKQFQQLGLVKSGFLPFPRSSLGLIMLYFYRYVEALRAQVQEKMQLYKITLPPLCSCGPDFWDAHPDTCANSCVFYKNHRGRFLGKW